MTEVVTPFSAGVPPLMGAEDGPCRDRAAGRTRRCRSARGSIAGALKWAGATVGAVWLAPAPALAYHDTIDNGRGGVPLDVILPIVGAVALGMIALAFFGRKTRKTKFKAGRQKRRAKSPVRKRR